MISREYETDLRLKEYINCYWYYNIQPDTEKHFDILPDGNFGLVVTIKNNRIEDSRLCGIWTKTVSIRYTENAEVFGISFSPLAIGGLLKFNIKNLLDGSLYIPLSQFHINEQILLNHLSSPKILTRYLDHRFLKLFSADHPDKRLKKCFDLINDSHGTITVNEISKTVGLSPRQLHRRIHNMMGIGIKEYSKIIRLKESLLNLKNKTAKDHFYYDQSHFIRTLKQYTGFTPKTIDLNNNDRFIQYYYFA